MVVGISAPGPLAEKLLLLPAINGHGDRVVYLGRRRRSDGDDDVDQTVGIGRFRTRRLTIDSERHDRTRLKGSAQGHGYCRADTDAAASRTSRGTEERRCGGRRIAGLSHCGAVRSEGDQEDGCPDQPKPVQKSSHNIPLVQALGDYLVAKAAAQGPRLLVNGYKIPLGSDRGLGHLDFLFSASLATLAPDRGELGDHRMLDAEGPREDEPAPIPDRNPAGPETPATWVCWWSHLPRAARMSLILAGGVVGMYAIIGVIGVHDVLKVRRDVASAKLNLAQSTGRISQLESTEGRIKTAKSLDIALAKLRPLIGP